MMLAPLAIAASAPDATPALKAGTFDPPRQAPDFTLPGSNGAPLKLADHRGKVVLLFFGFTHCPAVCPITTATLAAAHKQLGADAAHVQIIYVTVDSERDTPARMKQYLAPFDPSFLGGSGTAEQLAKVREDYGVFATREDKPGGDYVYGHSSFVYLIDPAGRLRALMPYGRPADDYVHDVRLLLASP